MWQMRKYVAFALLLGIAISAVAQAPLPIYTDNLVSGFQDWSWSCNRNFANTSPVHTGGYSIAVTNASGGTLSLRSVTFTINTSPYNNLSFWINGGPVGGQHLRVYGLLNGTAQNAYTLPALAANTWQQFTVPLSSLGVASKTNLNGFLFQNAVGGSQPVYYLDDIQLGAAPAPAVVNLNVDASQTIRPADARWAGVNAADWDGYLGNANTLSLLKEAGILALRWPGGSGADTYHWATQGANNANFYQNAINLGTNGQVFITVNYGTGTSNEAAAWVSSVNVTYQYHFQYWEIGNECYGSWENDANTNNGFLAHDPYTYAVRSAYYIDAMKAADPTIKIGVVAVPGDDSSINNTLHPAYNQRTGQYHNGWTPVMLATLKSLGVTPDFLIHHVYPQYTSTPVSVSPPSPCSESDPLLLQASVNWAADAATLRQEINDYFGTGGTNIELCCTENNSDSTGGGKQMVSIVNALYLADSLSQLMKTEFNSYLWWDLRNGVGIGGSYDPTLYGWRTTSDFGIISSLNSRNTPFYSLKLMQSFVRPGDTVLNASSDYLLLSAYATRKANGALAVLVINKDLTTSFNGRISLANFAPYPTADVRSYGIQQDEASRTNNHVPGAKDIATNAASVAVLFTNSFPPGTLTLFTFAPGPAQLSALVPQSDQFVLQLQGQPGTPYVIENSPDLFTWTPVSTNTLSGNVINITNAISPDLPQQFWRAVWQP